MGLGGGPRHKPASTRSQAKLQGKGISTGYQTRREIKQTRPGGGMDALPCLTSLARDEPSWLAGSDGQADCSQGTASGCSGFSAPFGERERGEKEREQPREGNGIEGKNSSDSAGHGKRQARDNVVQQETNPQGRRCKWDPRAQARYVPGRRCQWSLPSASQPTSARPWLEPRRRAGVRRERITAGGSAAAGSVEAPGSGCSCEGGRSASASAGGRGRLQQATYHAFAIGLVPCLSVSDKRGPRALLPCQIDVGSATRGVGRARCGMLLRDAAQEACACFVFHEASASVWLTALLVRRAWRLELSVWGPPCSINDLFRGTVRSI